VILRKLLLFNVILCKMQSMDDEMLTPEQAAEKLQVHVATVRKMLRDATLPGIKLGPRQWRIPARALRDYVDNALKGGATAKE
jgi:excisionase family DNA binding protein